MKYQRLKNIIKRMFHRIRYLMLVPLAMLLTGCDNTEEAFDHVQNQKRIEELATNASETASGNVGRVKYGFQETIAYYAYAIATWLKTMCVPIIIGSILIGVFGLLLIKKNIKIRRTCIIWFMIAIPIITLIVTFISAYYAGVLIEKV